jgi:hypothetical protein
MMARRAFCGGTRRAGMSRTGRVQVAFVVIALGAGACGSSGTNSMESDGGGGGGDAAVDQTSGDVSVGEMDTLAPGGADTAVGGSADPYFDHVVLLMHFDGQDKATTFTDSKAHAVTAYGAAQLSVAKSVFGGSSGAFDGSSAYLTLDNSDDWNFGAGDFTVELFVSFTGGIAGQGTIPTLFGLWGPTATNQSWELLYPASVSGTSGFNDQTDGTIDLIFSSTGADEVAPAVAWAPAADTWYHVAAVRHGGNFLYFVDGTLVGMKSIDANDGGVPDWTRTDPASNSGPWNPGAPVGATAAIHPNTSARLSIGVGVGAPGTVYAPSFLHGYVDEVRITKGVARYTSNFPRPAAPFPDR